MDISSGTNDSGVRHAIEPMFRRLGASITTFHSSADEGATSIAHDLMHLWLSRTLDPDDTGLASAYGRLSVVLSSRPLWDVQMQADAAKLVLELLRHDAARLPTATVIRYLKAAAGLPDRDDALLRLTLEGTLSALRAEPADDGHHEALTQIAADVVSAMRERGLAAGLQAWLTLHKDGDAYAHLYGEDPGTLMAKAENSQIPQTHPDLLRQAYSVMAARYPKAGPAE
jgi:hypothetical protein